MGIRIYEQPDGQFAAYSTTVDDFLIEDATKDEIEEWYVRRQEEQAREEIRERLGEAREGARPQGIAPGTYEEAVERASRN